VQHEAENAYALDRSGIEMDISKETETKRPILGNAIFAVPAVRNMSTLLECRP
jgi:hypothetical protein